MILNISDMDIAVYYILQTQLDNGDILYVDGIEYSDNICNLTYTDKMNGAIELSRADAFAILNHMEQAQSMSNITVRRRVKLSFDDELSYSGISDVMPSDARVDVSVVANEPKLIRTWEELSELPENHMYKIAIDDPNDCSGHIVDMSNDSRRFNYLSTHTFYGGKHKDYLASSERLQKCGFNVILDNWDKSIDGDDIPNNIIAGNVNLTMPNIVANNPTFINISDNYKASISNNTKYHKSIILDNSRRQFTWVVNINNRKK